MVSAVGNYFYSWMDVAILSAFVAAGITATRAEIGAYENAWRLTMVATMLSQAISTALFPQISQWNVDDLTDKIENAISIALLPSVLFVIPVFVGTTVLAKDLLRILFGEEFTVAWLVLIILMGEKILQSGHVVLSHSLQAIDRPDLSAIATIVAVIINIIMNILLIWRFGIVGAAIATTISFGVNTVIHAIYLNRFLKISIPVQSAGWASAASIFMGVCVYGVHSMISVNSILDLAVIVILGASIYAPIVLIYPPIRRRLQQDILPVIF